MTLFVYYTYTQVVDYCRKKWPDGNASTAAAETGRAAGGGAGGQEAQGGGSRSDKDVLLKEMEALTKAMQVSVFVLLCC